MYDVHLKHFVVVHVTVLGKGRGCVCLEGGVFGDSSRKTGLLSYEASRLNF